MINENEEKLLNELMEIRFLDSDKEDDDEIEEEVLEKIEKYERILFELSGSKEISIIPKLCNIAEDKATQLSAVEYVIEVVIGIVINNDIEEGMRAVIKGTSYMIPKAYQKAIKLHIWIIRDKRLREKYIEVLKTTNKEGKGKIIGILKDIMNMFDDEFNANEILQLI